MKYRIVPVLVFFLLSGASLSAQILPIFLSDKDKNPDPQSYSFRGRIPNKEFIEHSDTFRESKDIPEGVKDSFLKSAVGVKVSVLDSSTGIYSGYNGMGFVTQSDGREAEVVTNFHVIADKVCDAEQKNCRYELKNWRSVAIFTEKNMLLLATLVYYDELADLALLKIKIPEGRVFDKRPMSLSDDPAPKKDEVYFSTFVSFSQSIPETPNEISIIELPSIQAYEAHGYTMNIRVKYLGVMDGWTRLGFSGGCIVDRSGVCHGIVEAECETRVETLYIPSPVVLAFLHGYEESLTIY